MNYKRRMIEAVGNLDFTGDPVDEFVDGAFAILAAALAKMPETERENVLLGLEEGRAMRKAVAMFLGPRSQPYPVAPTNGGNGHVR
jgi:hypothetical protein